MDIFHPNPIIYIYRWNTGRPGLLSANSPDHSVDAREVHPSMNALAKLLVDIRNVRQHHQLFAVEQHGEKPGTRHGPVPEQVRRVDLGCARGRLPSLPRPAATSVLKLANATAGHPTSWQGPAHDRRQVCERHGWALVYVRRLMATIGHTVHDTPDASTDLRILHDIHQRSPWCATRGLDLSSCTFNLVREKVEEVAEQVS